MGGMLMTIREIVEIILARYKNVKPIFLFLGVKNIWNNKVKKFVSVSIKCDYENNKIQIITTNMPELDLDDIITETNDRSTLDIRVDTVNLDGIDIGVAGFDTSIIYLY